jgi:soluble lytic murein transglycosylase
VRFLLCLFVFLFVVATKPSLAEAALSDTGKKVYADAFRRADKKDYTDARKLAARGSEPLLGEFFAWLELTKTKGDGDFAELSAFLDSHPGWPQLGEIRRRAEESLPDGLTPAELLAWFGEESPSTVDGALRLAKALRADGQEVAATELLRETWVTGRFTRSQKVTFLDRYRDLLRRDDEMARLEILLERRSVASARRQARRLGNGYPKLAEARLRLALNRPGVDHAISRVPAALQNDPGLLYERGRWRQRRDRTEGVIELIDRATPVIRRPERWWWLRHWAARRAFGEGDIATAYRLANGHDLKKGAGFADGTTRSAPTTTSCVSTTASARRSALPAAPIGPRRPPPRWATMRTPRAGTGAHPGTPRPSTASSPALVLANRSNSISGTGWRSAPTQRHPSKTVFWSVWCACWARSINASTRRPFSGTSAGRRIRAWSTIW